MDLVLNDISTKFNNEALKFINSLFSFAQENRIASITPNLILYKLLNNRKILQLFEEIKYDINPLLSSTKNTLNDINIEGHSTRKGIIAFNNEAKSILILAFFQSKKFQNENVALEEILLGTLQSPSISSLLDNFNISYQSIENHLLEKMGITIDTHSMDTTPTLSKYSTDLTASAHKGTVPQIIDREKEINQLIRILIRQMKNNVILVGEPGVGKKSIVEGLALKIASGQVPDQLKNLKILSLNLVGIQSAAPGRMEALLEQILDEIKLSGNKILFINDLHTISTGESYDSNTILNILKPALLHGELHIIGATTLTNFRKNLERDATFSQQFETVKVEEPSAETTFEILKSMAKRLEIYHKVKISDEAINTAITLSKRYIQDKFLPDKAINLLDESSSKVAVEKKTEVSGDDIKVVISERTGIPVSKITSSDIKKLTNLEEELKSKVIGQDYAVHVVSEVIRRSRAGLKDPKKPIGTFLFLGPSGVGKTHLAKTLTKIIYDTEKAMIRLDMSEFSESHTVQRLIGSPPGYVGYEEGGQLTNPIWERPYSLILLDEIEKAHPKVFDIFLQVLDEGRLTDGQGRTVDFKNTVIIATSNIAADEILKKSQNQAKLLASGSSFDREKFYEEEIIPILREYFRPEFINRFDEVVVFNPLGIEELMIIAKLQIKDIQERLSDKKITINASDKTLQQYAQKSNNPAYGARPLIRLLQDNIENVIARKIINGELNEGQTITF